MQAAQQQLARVATLIELREFDRARMSLREGRLARLRGDLRDAEQGFAGIRKQVLGCLAPQWHAYFQLDAKACVACASIFAHCEDDVKPQADLHGAACSSIQRMQHVHDAWSAGC